MKTSSWIKILAGVAVVAAQTPLHAEDVEIAAQLSGDFTGIVGSPDQAQILLAGLRNGTAVTLSASDGRTVSIVPACGRMGWGNAYIVLSLAQEEFEQFGITNPTSVQLEAVLEGGNLDVRGSPRQVQGILKLCASAGDDWDRLAGEIGVSFAPARDHWRSVEGRFEGSGSRTRLEAGDRAKGEEGWSRAGSEVNDRSAQDSRSRDQSAADQNQTDRTDSDRTRLDQNNSAAEQARDHNADNHDEQNRARQNQVQDQQNNAQHQSQTDQDRTRLDNTRQSEQNQRNLTPGQSAENSTNGGSANAQGADHQNSNAPTNQDQEAQRNRLDQPQSNNAVQPDSSKALPKATDQKRSHDSDNNNSNP